MAGAPASELSGKTVKAGVLYKQGERRWNRRYFVLSSGNANSNSPPIVRTSATLAYYEDHSDYAAGMLSASENLTHRHSWRAGTLASRTYRTAS